MLLSAMPQNCGQSAVIQFTIGLGVYTGTATRMNSGDAWIITATSPTGLLAAVTPPIDEPVLFYNSSLIDSVLALL